MRFMMIAIITLTLLLCGSVNSSVSNASENDEWIKYATWRGQVNDMLVLSFYQKEVKSVFPVATGFRNASYIYYIDPPKDPITARVEVNKGRGKVWLKKQYWFKRNPAIRVQIYDDQPGWDDYEITLYLSKTPLSRSERRPFQREMNDAAYAFDIYHMEKALAEGNLIDAIRWAKSAYEINRLNWDILNKIGEMYYQKRMYKLATDVYIVLRDHGYLTDENWERFHEISPYEASRGMAQAGDDDSDDESAAGDEPDESAEFSRAVLTQSIPDNSLFFWGK